MLARTWLTVPGAELDRLGPQRLDRIDDHKIGHWPLFGGGEDSLDAGFGDETERNLGKPQPGCAKADLIGGFLTRKVERAVARGGDGGGGLKQERRFADPRLAA